MTKKDAEAWGKELSEAVGALSKIWEQIKGDMAEITQGRTCATCKYRPPGCCGDVHRRECRCGGGYGLWEGAAMNMEEAGMLGRAVCEAGEADRRGRRELERSCDACLNEKTCAVAPVDVPEDCDGWKPRDKPHTATAAVRSTKALIQAELTRDWDGTPIG